MKSILLFSTLLVTIGFTSCNKTAGEGGTSTITGKVYVIDKNGAGDINAEYYGMDEDVFIIYGNDSKTYSDKFATSYDGSYSFTNLTPGEYTVFAYSDCATCDSGIEAIKKTITVSNKKEVIEVGDLIIIQ